jgi:hypothetical protein
MGSEYHGYNKPGEYMIDLSKLPVIKIKIPNAEVSKKVQEKLFEYGYYWCGQKNKPSYLTCNYLFGSNWGKGELTYLSRDDENYFKLQPGVEIHWEDVIGPQLPFQVGDKVRAFGLDGEVIDDGYCNHGAQYKILVNFGNYKPSFTIDGKLYTEHKEPSLILIERPLKKIKKTFWVWVNKGKLSSHVMDDTYTTPDGTTIARSEADSYTKIPGTELILEVEVK